MPAIETIPGLLVAAAERDPDGIWLQIDEGALNFSTVVGRVGELTTRLEDAGIRRGDLVVVTTRNTAPYLLCWLALATLGAITIPTDPRGTATELGGLLGQVDAKVLITDNQLRTLVAEAIAGASVELEVLDVDVLVSSKPVSSREVADLPMHVKPDDVAVLIPTSGTTGRSKLVMQTQRAYAWAGEGFASWMDLHSDDRLMTSLPLFHINAPAYSVLGSLACGAGLVLLPQFSGGGFIDSARRYKATEFNAIGAMLEILMRQPPRDDDAETDLRLCYTGPSPAKEWQEAFEERFGLQIVCGYAMSETPYGLIWQRGTRPFGTLGTLRQHPVLGTVNHARVVDDAGEPVAPGDTGELLLKNPVVTPGYWGMADETAKTIVDGWLHTGDLVTPGADGTYTFVARKKEVLRRRGQNMSPTEIEEVIATHPDVAEVAVVGIASDLTEEEVKAFVVAEPGRDLDFAALRAWTAERLSSFKVPRFWQAIDVLPRTPTERVAKHKLPIGHQASDYDSEERS